MKTLYMDVSVLTHNCCQIFPFFLSLLCYVVQQHHQQMAYAVHIKINFSQALNEKRDAMTIFKGQIK